MISRGLAMRRAVRVAVVVSCTFLLAGCSIVRTIDPLWVAADPQMAAQLAGEWRDPGKAGEQLTIRTLGDGGGLTLRWTEPDGDWGASIGRVIVLDAERLLEINLATLREKGDAADKSTLEGFTYFRIAPAESRLRLYSLSEEGLADVVAKVGVTLSKSIGCDDAGPAKDKKSAGDEPCYLTIEGDPRSIVELFRRHAGEIFSDEDDDPGLMRATEGSQGGGTPPTLQ
jgi:hypothetical protein